MSFVLFAISIYTSFFLFRRASGSEYCQEADEKSASEVFRRKRIRAICNGDLIAHTGNRPFLEGKNERLFVFDYIISFPFAIVNDLKALSVNFSNFIADLIPIIALSFEATSVYLI